MRLAHLTELVRLTYLIERTDLIDGSLLVQLIRLIHLVHRADMIDMIHLLHSGAVVHASLDCCCGCLRGGSMLFVATPRVRIAVYS